MKILSKIILFLIAFLALCIGLLYAANNGKLDQQIKHGLQYYLGLYDINTQFVDCQFKDGVLTASQVKFKLGSGLGVINNLQIHIDVFGRWSDPELSAEIMPAIMVVWDENNNKFLEVELASKLTRFLLKSDKSYEWNLSNIQIPNISDINHKPLETGNFNGKYSASKAGQALDCSLNFGKSTYLNVTTLETGKSTLKIEMNDIPIMFYKVLDRILPDNKLLTFLNEFIKAGHIKNGTIFFDQNAEKTLLGKVKISKLDLTYAEEYPMIKDMDVDVDIQGSNINFNINSAYSSDILLSDGLVAMDWQGLDNTVLIVNIRGAGPAKSLTEFISDSNHQSMAKANIDLRKIKGKVDIDVDIKIPLKPGTQNIYNITAQIPNSSLNVFKDNALLRKAKLSGLFNGDQVILSGEGKINGFNSDLNFIYNITDESEFSHKLDIKTRFKTRLANGNRNTKIAFVSLLGGDSIVDVQYINKDSQGVISVNSDISNLDLYFDKLGIRKKKNEHARIIVNGIFEDPTSGVLDFAITGDGGLNVNADVIIKNESLQAHIKEIKTKETDLSANISIHKDLITADLKGKTLDLSDADMLQFLEKERDDGSAKVRLNVAKVRLKNNIWLDDLKMMFECDKDRCYSGYIDSKIGSRSIEMLLTANGNNEDWLIKCSNAGALLRGLGAYDDMKSGNLVLNINTSRKEVKSGEIIPILDGSFAFERFVLSDTPTMSRLASFVSLPGFLNMISGNKDIVFSGMTGKFSFANDILSIKDSAAEGPYFDFTLKGNIDIKNRLIDIKGHVTPELYGISSVVGSIPLIGNIFTGNRKRGGLLSGSYHVQNGY
ncbi:MAG: DUF3971 domain-containing protein [Rickettsiaceae bacterium]|nr:DUF3971 domain-containing protein [Rickettsiaceae bacterium]MDP4832688.1 DUF3971 domain-containing protein [Rickettsiaceae bacterium]MDP5021180.1 DUF3971 domain-containing protein [Rickettsiaceae bacterium]MDP5083535.1 DUF3971 domain-containing protein [Rickettsiaceae bacterium]